MKFGYNQPGSFREEVVCNCGRTDDGASPGAFGSGELKNLRMFNGVQ